MKERELEKRFVEAVKKQGGMCPKFVSPGYDGMPDRIVLLPNGKVGFVEIKQQGIKPRAVQLRRLEQLRTLGFQVFVLNQMNQIGEIIHEIQTT